MSYFREVLVLRERAEEDVYFARRDRELIRRLHEQRETGDRTPDKGARSGVARQGRAPGSRSG